MRLAGQIEEDAWNVIAAVPAITDLAGKNVLVTGGTGIIGLHCMAVLGIVDAHYGLGSLTYTSLHEIGEFNDLVSHLASNARWIKADMAVGSQIKTLPRVNVIIHAAGYGQPAKFMANPLATIALNTSAIIHMDSLLEDDGRAMFISSSEVYSGHPYAPHHESYNGTTTPQHPRGAYIEGKRCGEAIAHAINTTGNKIYKVARVSLSYGPGTRKNDDRVINHFIRQAVTDGVIACKDSGSAGRTYNYVSDCIEMLFSILLRGKHEVYNVAGTSDISIRELANTIANLTGTKATFPDGANHLGDSSAPALVKSSIDNYVQEFRKSKFIDLVEGLKRTINWQRLLYGKT